MDTDPKPSGNLVAKIASAVFAAIVAPIIAGIGINVAQKKLDEAAPAPATAKDAPTATKDAPTTTKEASAAAKDAPTTAKQAPAASDKAKGATGAPSAAVAIATKPTPPPVAKPAAPKPIPLFNGTDLKGFETFLAAPRNAKTKQMLGLNNDPNKVFSVVHRPTPKGQQRGAVIRVSGEVDGALETEKDYENYHLSLEYQWGEKTWHDNPDAPRRSGISFHFTAAGNPRRQPWRPSYHCRIGDLEGTGDLATMTAGVQKISMMVEATSSETGPKGRRLRHDYSPGSPPMEVVGNAVVHHLGAPNPLPARDSIPPLALQRWHKVDIYCQGDRVKVFWDGKKVNEASKLSQTRGRIQLCSEGAETFFRNIVLEPIPKDSP